jgi:hypothetical protein
VVAVDAWSESELPTLRATWVDLLEQVARHLLEAGEARSEAERGLEVDALNESLWRLAMEAENALGLREAVIERVRFTNSSDLQIGQIRGERVVLPPGPEGAPRRVRPIDVTSGRPIVAVASARRVSAAPRRRRRLSMRVVRLLARARVPRSRRGRSRAGTRRGTVR